MSTSGSSYDSGSAASDRSSDPGGLSKIPPVTGSSHLAVDLSDLGGLESETGWAAAESLRSIQNLSSWVSEATFSLIEAASNILGPGKLENRYNRKRNPGDTSQPYPAAGDEQPQQTAHNADGKLQEPAEDARNNGTMGRGG